MKSFVYMEVVSLRVRSFVYLTLFVYLLSRLFTCEGGGHVDVVLRHVSHAVVDHVELTLLLSVVTLQDVHDGVHRPVHVS